MQNDSALAGLAREVHILGVNGIGHQADNATICAGRTLPWLQDVPGVDVWTSWQVAYRDVIILNADNEITAVFNLTDQDLGDPTHYDALRDLLVQSTTAP